MHDLGHTRPFSSTPATRIQAGDALPRLESVAEEVPVSMAYNGEVYAVMMATPADLEDFAMGFSLTEGAVGKTSDLVAVNVVRYSGGIELQMETAVGVTVPEQTRRLSGRTGCGICGKEDIARVLRNVPQTSSTVRFSSGAILRAIAGLADRQPMNAETGAVHAAGWADADGLVPFVREDVGRHNALDKIIGAMARASTSAASGFLVLTSRGSFELVQKAAVLGVALVATVSAPTALAIRIAHDAGITLIGFARADRLTVYSHPERVVRS